MAAFKKRKKLQKRPKISPEQSADFSGLGLEPRNLRNSHAGPESEKSRYREGEILGQPSVGKGQSHGGKTEVFPHRIKGKILAIDYGTKKIGLAICDASQLMVFGRGIISREKGFEFLVKNIKKLCEEEPVQKIIIGLPIGEDGSENERTKRIRNFGAKLGLYLKEVPIDFIDESFSSFEAQTRLRNEGNNKNQFQQDDEYAAIIILERYLKSL